MPADAIIPANPGQGEATARTREAFARVARSRLPRIVLATHGRGGGVARHVRELAGLLRGRAEVLVLRPHRRSFVVLEVADAPGACVWYHRDGWPALVALLQGLGVARLHVHHVQGLPPALLDLGRAAGCAWDVTVHDYYPACPQYQLTDASGRYCGEPDEAGCARCLAAQPPQWPMDIGQWRSAFARWLAGATRVIAPSHDTASRLARHFPGIAPLAWPHPDRAAVATRHAKVLVLGGLSPAKGMALLEACARDARDRGLPLRFRVVGHIAWPTDTHALPLTFTGEYAEDDLGAILEQERGDAVFFPAQWPETYSYTLTAALGTGLPLLATDLGAFGERLAGAGQARLLPWDASPQAFNDALVSLAIPASGAGAARPVAGVDPAAYLARYLEGVTAVPARDDAPCFGTQAFFAAPDEALPQATLVELFDDGVRCGNGRSLAELRGRLPAADREREQARALAARLADAEARLAALGKAADRAGEEAARHEGDARAAREHAAALEASTSWRLTAPLRALARLLRR